MKVEILKTAADVAARGAFLFEEAVKEHPALVAALPTGRTPVLMYRLLAQKKRAGLFSLGRASVFNLDEVLSPPDEAHTFFQFMTKHVWEPLGVPLMGRHIPQGDTKDPEAECARYEAEIAAAGGLDLAILGIGADGHIAYNLPRQVKARTHVVTLDAATIATLGPRVEARLRAITMGVETINSARSLLLLATGSSKADALRRMSHESPTDEWPCTYFKDHKDLTVIADRAAAAHL